MKNKIIFITIMLWFLTVCFFIFKNNPTLLSKSLLSEKLEHNLVWNTVTTEVTKKSNLNYSESSKMYRSSITRNSTFYVKKIPSDFKKKWTSKEENLGIHKASKASVIGDDERVYVGYDDSWFRAYNKKTGALVWEFLFADSDRGIHSTAALDDKNVYVGTYRGSFYSIDKKNGRLNWMKIVGETIGASPLLFENQITLSVETMQPNGYLIQLDKNSGDVIWKSNLLGAQSHSSPALDLKNNIVLLGANNSTVQGFNYQTGQRIWTTKIAGQLKGTFVISNDIAYASNWGKETLAIEVKTGKIKWKTQLLAGSQTSCVLSEKWKTLMTADLDGNSYWLNLEDGQINKLIKAKEIFNQKSSPVILATNKDENIFFLCEKKYFCLADFKGNIKKKWPFQKIFTGSPFFDETQLYLTFDNGPVESYQFIF